MTKEEQKAGRSKRRLLVPFMGLSLLAHILFVVYLHSVKKPPTPKRLEYTKIRIIEREKQSSLPPATQPPSADKQKKVKPQTPKPTPVVPNRKKGKAGKVNRFGAYDPKKLVTPFTLGEPTKTDELHYGMDPVRNLHDQPYLQTFADDLNHFIDVPNYLIENSNYLYASVRIQKLGGRYIIKKYRGTPYARALLYETMADVLRREVYLEPLRQGDIKSFEVHFLFRAFEISGKFVPPPEVKVAHNRITITRYKVGINKAARYLMAMTDPVTGLAQIGPNILGPLMDLVEFFSDEKEQIPLAVRKLHRSKAFARH